MSTEETPARDDTVFRDRTDGDASPRPATDGSTDDSSAPPARTVGRAPRDGRDRSKVLKRVLIGAGVLAVILALIVGGGIWFLTDRWAGNIDRVSDVFAGIDEETRP